MLCFLGCVSAHDRIAVIAVMAPGSRSDQHLLEVQRYRGRCSACEVLEEVSWEVGRIEILVEQSAGHWGLVARHFSILESRTKAGLRYGSTRAKRDPHYLALLSYTAHIFVLVAGPDLYAQLLMGGP